QEQAEEGRMKHVDVPEARRMFAAELRRMARQGHGREFAELSTPAGARIVRLVSDQHPDWRAALDQLDRPVNTSADWSVDALRASTTPSREQRERDAAAQYGFSEDAVRADPLRRDMCQTAALFAERDQARADVEREGGRN